MISMSCLLFITLAILVLGGEAQRKVLKVRSTYDWDPTGPCRIWQHAIATTLRIAKRALATSHVDVLFPPSNCSTVYFWRKASPLIDITNINPIDGKYWLHIRGHGMDETTLVSDGNLVTVKGKYVYRVEISDMTFARSYLPVTQGTVVNAWSGWPGFVRIKLEPGYPSPNFPNAWEGSPTTGAMGKYLRRYKYVGGRCERSGDLDEAQVHWNLARALKNPHYRFRVAWGKTTPYAKNEVVAIKAKHSEFPYIISDGDQFTFSRIRWTENSRGAIRRVNNVHINDCRIDYTTRMQAGAKPPCLATNEGGPQIGQKPDPPIYNIHVKNFVASGTGDDTVAFFNVRSGSIKGCTIKDSFARALLKYCTQNLVESDNSFVRCEPRTVACGRRRRQSAGPTKSECPGLCIADVQKNRVSMQNGQSESDYCAGLCNLCFENCVRQHLSNVTQTYCMESCGVSINEFRVAKELARESHIKK